ncbi:MAG: hypothetical protein P4M08_14550 [Oligoflexia bacterium]|nr:hypothetical protein [Oligoflexia bacterium]
MECLKNRYERSSNLLWIAIIAIVFGSRIAVAADNSPSPMPKAGVPWSAKMQGLYKTLAELLTDVSSDRRFNDPANKKRIEREAGQLASLSHDLNKKDMVSLDADPTVPMVAGLLARETKRAVIELKRDNRAYARSIIRSVPGYCITCHTRNSSGPQFSELPFEPTTQALSPVERGEFFAASRQFDRAQQEFLKVIQDPKAAASYNFDWERAIHQSLAIAVRVKQDPQQAKEIVQAVLSMKNAPVSVKEDAKAWKTSIQEWLDEPGHQALTEEGLHAEALRLMARARETQKYPVDRTADILYLRASAITHDLLQKAPNGRYASDALLLAGIAYEVLSPLRTEDLHDLYYEACVRKSPHTPIADACYRRYEQSTIFNYTGSSGTDVPQDVQEKLMELKELAMPQVQINHGIQ